MKGFYDDTKAGKLEKDEDYATIKKLLDSRKMPNQGHPRVLAPK